MQGQPTINVIKPELAEPIRIPQARRLGLGDVVAIAAKPIAKIIHLTNCGGCSERQAKLNALVPDIRHPLKH